MYFVLFIEPGMRIGPEYQAEIPEVQDGKAVPYLSHFERFPAYAVPAKSIRETNHLQ